MTARWAEAPPPEHLRELIERLETWASTAAQSRRLAQRVRVRPDELTSVVDLGDADLIDVAIEEGYLADPDVPEGHLRFVIGHEIGEVEWRGRLTGKAKEHACDCVGAELVGTEVAAAALDGYRRWQKRRGALGDDLASDSHPPVDERIRHVREQCV